MECREGRVKGREGCREGRVSGGVGCREEWGVGRGR